MRAVFLKNSFYDRASGADGRDAVLTAEVDDSFEDGGHVVFTIQLRETHLDLYLLEGDGDALRELLARADTQAITAKRTSADS